MGFSTSGAVVVILIGFLVAVSVFVPTLFSVGAETGEAFSTQSEQLRDQANTDIEIESFEMVVDRAEEEDDDVESLTLNVTNTGSSTLSVDETDVVLLGEYYRVHGSHSNSNYQTNIVVNGERRGSSDAWVPGSHLEVDIRDYGIEQQIDGMSTREELEEGDRVQVTTERGISDSAALTETDPEEGG